MAWVKLDDQIFAHPKIINLSKDAKLLHLAALTYCAGQLTDGIVSPGALRMACALVDADPSCVVELLEAGLWEPELGGSSAASYRIHDYLDYNPSGEQVRAQRAATNRRQSDYRERHVGSNGFSNGVSNGVTNGGGNASPHASRNGVSLRAPSPSPIPSDPPVDTSGGETPKERMAPAARLTPTHGALALASPSPHSSNVVPLPTPLPSARPSMARAPDPLWDACVTACGGTAPSNKVERGKWNKGLAALRESGATPDEIALRAKRYRRRYGERIALNPMALASNWTQLSEEVHDHAQQSAHDTRSGSGNQSASRSGGGDTRRPSSSNGYRGYTGPHLLDADGWDRWEEAERAKGHIINGH